MNLRTKLTAIAVFVLALALPAAALEYNDGKITWTYVPVEGTTNEVCLGDGTNGCVSASVEGAITLPDTIGGKRVTVVAANAFKGCTKVTGVSILGNLEWIEEGAFDGATSLKTFGTLNRNETFFTYQGSLYMGDWESAELVRVPPALEAEEFTGLVKPHVWYVYPGAFNGCANIQKIQVNYYSAEALFESSFVGCTSFAEFVWVDGYWDDVEYCVRDGVLYCGDYERDGWCELLKWPTAKPLESFESMVLSEYAEFNVADGAFAGNPMESITLPNRASVGAFAFVGCSNLKTVKFLGYPDWQCGVLECAEEAGLNLQKVIYPGFPRDMTEEWEWEIEWFKDTYPESKIVFERGVDPNLGKTNITIPYTERWDLCWKYDFEAYAKDLTTLTFEGPCPDEFLEILEICSNVTTVVYSANPLYRDYDYDWESWKSVMSWDWANELPSRTLTFQEGAIPAETQFYFEDPEYRDSLYGISYYDEAQDRDVYLSPIWPARGELKIPNGVYELGEGALCGLGQVTKLVLPRSMAWDGCIDENVGFETMFNLAEIEVEGGISMSMCEESSILYSKDGCLYYDWQLFRVPPAYAVDEFVLDGWDYPCWNALSGCRNIKKLTAGNSEMLDAILYELDLTGCDQLVEFGYKGGNDECYRCIDGAIYEDWENGQLCLLLWPNAKRPVVFAENTVAVDCEAFRYFAHPETVAELTLPRRCDDFDLYTLADEYGFGNVAKLVFMGYPCGLYVDLLEVMPKLAEIAYVPDPFFALDWEWVREEFEGTGVNFTVLPMPEGPIWNMNGGELYGDYDPEDGIRVPCVWPDLVGEATVPNGVYYIGENAFACMSNLTALTFPKSLERLDAGVQTFNAKTGVPVDPPRPYSPFVGCLSLSKLTFNGACPEGLWEVLELTPSIREVYYNDFPWYGESGWIWREFIAEFKVEHPESPVKFVALPLPKEPVWSIEDGELYGEYYPEDGWRVPCVWPDLVGEATVPNGVYYIGENAFACMSSLTALTIPASVESIDAWTDREGYWDYDKSEWVVTGEVDIVHSPFVGCTSLKKLVFQGGYVPSGAWELLEFTPGIEEVVVPSWTYREEGDFGGVFNEWLDWFVMDYKAEHPDSTIVFKKDDGTEISGREEYVPWKVEGDTMTVDWGACIEENAFVGVDLSGVTKLVLPPYVDSVEDGAFGALKNLREVEVDCIYGGEMDIFEEEMVGLADAFGESQRVALTLKPIVLWSCDCEGCGNDGSCPICKTDDEWGDCNEKCGCPGHWESVAFAIPGEMFSGCEWIETLAVEAPAFAIGDYAFSECVNLKSVTIPASVEWIGESAFAGCTSLDTVYFNGNAPYGCLWLYEEASSNLVSYVKFGTTGWTGLDGDVGMPTDGLWPVWDEDDFGARRVEYGKATVKYLLNGELLSSKEVAVGEPFALIPDSEKTGYTFDGWYDEAGEKVADGAEFIIDDFFGSLIFSGSLSANSYAVRFDANGGSAVESGKATFDAAFGELPKTTRTGYTFAGWLDAGGKQVTAETKMTTAADVTLMAQWTANSYAVRFDANGGEGTMADQKFVYDQPQALKANAFERKTFEFLGWAKTVDGAVEFNDAVTVNNLLAENGASMTLYAVWKRSEVTPGETKTVVDEDTGKTKEIVVLPEDEPEFVGDVAAVYDGLVRSDVGVIVGTIQVKAAKANKNTGIAKLTATMQLAGEKKLSFKGGEWGPGSEYAEMTLKDGRTLTIAIGEYGLVGTFGNYEISGSANIFSSKKDNDKAIASGIMAKCKAFSVVYYEGDAMGTVILTIGSKGKVTAAIQTPSGASAKATAQLVIGNGVCCIPVVSTSKKVSLAFAVWIDPETLECIVDGPDSWDGYVAGKAGGDLEADVVFRVADPDAVSDLLGDDTFAEFLPEESVTLMDGKKLVVADGAKPGKIAWDKKEEDIDWNKSKIDGYNVSGLKLSYTAKTGAFKGSFKAYALVKGKVKSFTFKVTGVILNGCGYGTATYKKSVIPVEIDL